jgi:hypothetical protein
MGAAMSTKRTPLARPLQHLISDRALRAFRHMRRLESQCTCPPRDWDGEYWKHRQCAACDAWYEQHNILHSELAMPPWRWPCNIDADPVQERAEDFSLENIPTEVLYATAGVDVQKDRLVAVILGWSRARAEVRIGTAGRRAVRVRVAKQTEARKVVPRCSCAGS